MVAAPFAVIHGAMRSRKRSLETSLTDASGNCSKPALPRFHVTNRTSHQLYSEPREPRRIRKTASL